MEKIVERGLFWAEKMAHSEMTRRKDSLQYQKSKKGHWDYTTGLLLLSLERLWKVTNEKKYIDYVKETIDSYVNEDGSINSYRVDEYNIDQINCGRVLFNLYDKTKEEKYKKAIFLLMKQLETHPRTSEKGFWHKQIYPYQMWLDGIYMGSPFYAQFSKVFGKPEGFDDVALQIILMNKNAKDKKTGLLYHAWDETKSMYWADPKTGKSPNFWSRAMGWYGMGILDSLDYFPKDHKKIPEILDIFKSMMDALIKYMDEKTGLWYQVTDKGDKEGNYLEASGSAMFLYCFAKAINNGYLDKEYEKYADKTFNGIISELIQNDDDGLVSIKNCCLVAGLGGHKRRDGSFEYYISEPVVLNDRKTTGSFISACIEYDKLKR